MRALIVYGGWDGHQPEEVSQHFKSILENIGYEVTLKDTLACFKDISYLQSFNLIIPCWTMGEIQPEESKGIREAIASGIGLAGCHGGMCDAFRQDVDWQFMTGGNWVSHPGGDDITYTVHMRNSSSSLVEGIADFEVTSEQYYLHVDPNNEVLATTRFPIATGDHTTNGTVDMPVIWTKKWGKGRVFYCSLGHVAEIVKMPEVTEIMKRGFLWASHNEEG
ncbi:ThuA domain-containing protein [Vallitalea okinawensis]|uniref:ThuA domain-containing protein n=1 Tax=Vallitalea okinawensis TaxID=2078660 RepID=UPI000CFAABFF|nr:ThuA domain-containing protein [Vallitalea okinawensis]